MTNRHWEITDHLEELDDQLTALKADIEGNDRQYALADLATIEGQCHRLREKLQAQRRSRRFHLVRAEDESGVSGTGIVAVGVEFPSGYVEMEWLNDENENVNTEMNGHASYPGGIEDAMIVHGHGGKTEVKWIDE